MLASTADLVDIGRRLSALGYSVLGYSVLGYSALGYDVDWTERHTFRGYQRFNTADPHGNRLELMAPAPGC